MTALDEIRPLRNQMILDIFFQPVMAKSFLSDAMSFSDSSLATIHSGFAHAAFTTLLDLRYCILPVLANKVSAQSDLFVVGHSQGAAMATLVHAFLHHAMRDADRTGPGAISSA